MNRTLNNGVVIPAIGFGTFRTEGESCIRAVTEAVECGYRLFDTAEAYGNEEAVGAALRSCGIDRKDLFISTKVNYRSYEDTEGAVMRSLRRLGVEYLDLVLLHWPFGNYYAAWRKLEEFYRKGVIRAIGVSNFEPDRLIDLILFNEIVPQVDQIETNLYCQRKKEKPWLEKYRVLHEGYTPMGRTNAPKMLNEPVVKQLAESYGKTAGQIILRFLLEEGVVSLPKSTSAEHIKENMEIFDFSLNAEDRETLRALDRNEALIGNPTDPVRVESAFTW